MAASDAYEKSSYVDAIVEWTRRRIEIFEGAGEVWRFAESLKSISEDTAQEYEGRALYELIQNGFDALEEDGRGRICIRFEADVGEYGCVYVANEGTPFADANFKAITEFALSDKAAGEGIGNKGLGFRSVLQLTDWPEIYSKRQSGNETFDGFCFRFATEDDLVDLLEDEARGAEVAAKVSPLALPVPASTTDPVVKELAEAGYATVVRLPLRSGHAADAVTEQVEALVDGDAPVLLFLSRIESLRIVWNDDEPSEWVLTRDEQPFSPLRTVPWISEVDLGPNGRFLRAVREVDGEGMAAAIEASIAGREIDEKWATWSGTATVSIALGLGSIMPAGRMYTFLPMSDSSASPFAGHVHAPFFTKLARLDISESVPLNDFLLDEIAALAKDLLTELTTLRQQDLPEGLTLDLVCWSPADRLISAFSEADSPLEHAPLVPVLGRRPWGTITSAYQWDSESSYKVMTARRIASVGVSIVDPAIPANRLLALDSLHRTLLDRSMQPETEEVAEWAEKVASKLKAPEGADLEVWASFYDDLAACLGQQGEALRGRRIIIDQRGKLVEALGGDDQTGRSTVFFAPGDALDEDSGARLPRGLRALQRRMRFTHPEIPWNVPGNPPRRRPGRRFLADCQLVRDYRTERVFDALDDLLNKRSSPELKRDALLFAYRQFGTFNDTQRGQLRRRRLFVPTTDGRWLRARDALFHPAWGTPGARRMERILSLGGRTVPELAEIQDHWISTPGDWPSDVDAIDDWLVFLEAAGVGDGLLPRSLGQPQGNGSALAPTALARRFGLEPPLTRSWSELVHAGGEGLNHPYTTYRFAQPLTFVPGVEGVRGLGPEAREEFAQLLLLGLRSWDDAAFAVRVSRPNRPSGQQDPSRWPTPLVAQLSSESWIPVHNQLGSDAVDFVRPDEVWFGHDREVPPFIPGLLANFRRSVEGQALARLRDVGLRLWGESQHSPDLIRELGLLLEDGAVPTHLASQLKRPYRDAWAEAARLERWPWRDDEDPCLAVTDSSGLAAIRLSEADRLFVGDVQDPLKESLLEAAGYAVLVAPEDGSGELIQLLSDHGVEVTGFSETTISVHADGVPVLASNQHRRLVEIADWLPVLVGLVIELRSTSFVRRSEKTVRRMLRQVQSMRLIHAAEVEALIEGMPTDASSGIRSLPIADRTYPTIVVWGCEPGWELMQAATPAICQLLGQPDLQPAFELSLMKLRERLGEEIPAEISDDDLVYALGSPLQRVVELRRGLVGDLFDLVHRLRPTLISLMGVERIDEVVHYLSRVHSERVLRSVLEGWAGELRVSAEELISAARNASTLGTLRDDLGLGFADFNAALRALGGSYSPITHPDRHERAFDTFVIDHTDMIRERLREAYAPGAIAGEDITGYVDGRRLQGLVPDDAWLQAYEVPPPEVIRTQVATWLGQHGADPDLDKPSSLPALDEMRRENFERLNEIVTQLQARVMAWCRLRAEAPPVRWTGTPTMLVRGELESTGLGDLVHVDADAIMILSGTALGWPTGMATAMDLDVLGLREEDLLEPSPSSDSHGSDKKDHKTIPLAGDDVAVGTGNLAGIADAAYRSLDEAFLDQSGTTHLGQVQAPSRKVRGSAGQKPLIVATASRMTDDQRTAIGLVGEVAARAWLERRYGGVKWCSGYSSLLTGDESASDSLGYDFEVRRGKSSLFFEVKALVGEPTDTVEFEMGESEVRTAQICARGDRYRVLLVTSVLNPELRRIFNLPSPFSRKGAGHFRVVGRGLRYRCAIDAT